MRWKHGVKKGRCFYLITGVEFSEKIHKYVCLVSLVVDRIMYYELFTIDNNDSKKQTNSV